MVDTFTFTFHQGKGLGFTVIEKTSPNMLSNTVIQEITGEPALSSPLKPGDALISANGLLLANLTHNMCIDRLKNSPRPLTIMFARPNKNEWLRIQKEIDPVMFSCSIKRKKMYGIFSKMTNYTLNIGKDSLFIFDNSGDLEKKIDYSQLAEVSGISAGFDPNEEADCTFNIVMRAGYGKDLSYVALSPEDKIKIVYIIDLARQSHFLLPPPEISDAQTTASPKPVIPAKNPSPPPPVIAPPAPSNNNYPKPPPMVRTNSVGNEPDYIRTAITATGRGPYWMLYYTKVDVRASAGDRSQQALPSDPRIDFASLLQPNTKIQQNPFAFEKDYLSKNANKS